MTDTSRTGRTKRRGLSLSDKTLEILDEASSVTKLTKPAVIELLVGAMGEYLDDYAEGPLPLKIVPKRDYEKFMEIFPKLELRLPETVTLPPRQEPQPSVDHSIYERPKRKTARKKASNE